MTQIAIWSVEDNSPSKLESHTGHLEKHLETWIEHDASMVMVGLHWVRRQGGLPDGSRFDLLGITDTGDWVIAELKAGAVGIATLSQALHYATCLGTMSVGEVEALVDPGFNVDRLLLRRALESLAQSPRNIQLLLIGTERAPRLEQAISFLGAQGLMVPIRVTTFQLFQESSGRILMAREVEDLAVSTSPVANQPSVTVDDILEQADASGSGELLRAFRTLADKHGIPLRAWPTSYTMNYPKNRRRTMVYLAPRPNGVVEFGYSADLLADTLGLTEQDVRDSLGDHFFDRRDADVKLFYQRLDALFSRAQQCVEGGIVIE